jgi:cell fate regulator YaaT (PSP1 superfamily)
MGDLVGICFKPTGKVYYFSAVDLELKPGDLVIAETTKGQELAEVVCQGPCAGRPKDVAELKPVLRRATPEDVERGRENERRGCEARRVCQRLVSQLELPVKLVDVEVAFDGSRMTFAFASEDRVDFRELQHELRERYLCEIEVRQIGVRDQAKILGGLGPCGRHLCCASFLRSFQPVTIRMAKDQDLSLNPSKISGLCGRLMCCLRYEHQVYRAAREGLPEVGSVIETTTHGRGEVVGLDVLPRRVTINTDEGVFQIDADEITSVISRRTRAAGKDPEQKAAAAKQAPLTAAQSSAAAPEAAAPSAAPAAPVPEGEAPAKKRRRRGRRSRRRGKTEGEAAAGVGQAPTAGGPSES